MRGEAGQGIIEGRSRPRSHNRLCIGSRIRGITHACPGTEVSSYFAFVARWR